MGNLSARAQFNAASNGPPRTISNKPNTVRAAIALCVIVVRTLEIVRTNEMIMKQNCLNKS